MSEARLGWVPSKETREKLRVANLGKSASPETRAKLSAAGLGRKLSPEALKKMVESRRNGKGFSVSPEARAKISAAQKGKPKKPGRKVSAEHRAKQSARQRGKKQSPELVAKRTAGMREAWKHRKAEATRLKAEKRAQATFLRTGIKPAPPENPKQETQGKLFD